MSKKTIAAIAVLVIIILSPIVKAAEKAGSMVSPQASSSQAVGEWVFISRMPARASTAIMTIKKDAKGKYEGTWVQLGESALSDITFENGELKFVQKSSLGGKEIKTTYEGAVAGGKITGRAHSPLGNFTFEGTLPGEIKTGADVIVGEWQMTVMMPEREIVEKLIITSNADGTLAGKWEAQIGENTISDVKFEADRLTFNRTSKFGNREAAMTFEGTVDGDSLRGEFKGERGKWPVSATRVTAAGAESVRKPAEVRKAEPNTVR